MEDALHQCKILCETDQCAARMFNALDVVVAFYTSSLEDGTCNGNLIFASADHRAASFMTTGINGTEVAVASKFNDEIFRELKEFQKHLANYDCEESGQKQSYCEQNDCTTCAEND